jgi:hypothetical protein
MGAGTTVPTGPQLEGPKSPILQNLVWFALGMIITGVVGFVAFDSWLQAQIKAQVQSAETVQYIVSQNGFRLAVQDFVKPVNERINGITMIAIPAGSQDYGCGQERQTESNNLVVMSGLKDGTGCGVGNVNYYKELRLHVPQQVP